MKIVRVLNRIKKRFHFGLLALVVLMIALFLWMLNLQERDGVGSDISKEPDTPSAPEVQDLKDEPELSIEDNVEEIFEEVLEPSHEFNYVFDTTERFQETGTAEKSPSPYWWLDSGAYLIIENGVGKTVQGVLPEHDKWRRLYAVNNPIDTANGYYPQNIFRLLTLKKWGNSETESAFMITAYNKNESVNSNESNGVFLFSRYMDENNTYYGGIRVDGKIVIKKKWKGVYRTLAIQEALPGFYDRLNAPNLLPLYMPILLHIESQTHPNGTVTLILKCRISNNGTYQIVAIDDGTFGTPFAEDGRVGIRTDFMDVIFDEFWVRPVDR